MHFTLDKQNNDASTWAQCIHQNHLIHIQVVFHLFALLRISYTNHLNTNWFSCWDLAAGPFHLADVKSDSASSHSFCFSLTSKSTFNEHNTLNVSNWLLFSRISWIKWLELNWISSKLKFSPQFIASKFASQFSIRSSSITGLKCWYCTPNWSLQ